MIARAQVHFLVDNPVREWFRTTTKFSYVTYDVEKQLEGITFK